MLTREALEEREIATLAPYAARSRFSRGRVYPEKEHPYRTCYQRDRDRIIHSLAFRKMEYKTQVFVNHEGDYYRTRLTHTLEAAQVARSVARSLRLNEDLTEAIALAHDIGHTPFGHSGEEALAELMEEHGGFEHNRHGLRVVTELEKRYPDFDGLNLTYEVREGIIKHTTRFDHPEVAEFDPEKRLPTLEGQVVNIADEIAYDSHDIDDGITSGLIREEDLAGIELWDMTVGEVKQNYPRLSPQVRHYQIVRSFINTQINNLIESARRNIERATREELEERRVRLIDFEAGFKELRQPLRDFLLKNLYHHYRVVKMANKSKRYLKEIFAAYTYRDKNELKHGWKQLPPEVQAAVDKYGLEQAICDYIAGMTDRYALDEYQRLFEPYERV